jgi:uncharacterized protein (TIGR02266 family)
VSAHPATAAAVARPRILVVDDVPMFRELERLFLAKLGVVSVAGTGAEALEIALVERPEVVLLDFHLPDCDGDELCREMYGRGELTQTAVVMVTTGRPEDHERAVRAGAADVLAKPLARGALVQSVGRFLGRPANPISLPRVRHTGRVRLATRGGESEGTIANLSRGGLFIEAASAPTEGSELRLEFELPGRGDVLAPTAKAIWRRESAGTTGFGVRFLALGGADSRDLERYVHERGGTRFYWSASGAS